MAGQTARNPRSLQGHAHRRLHAVAKIALVMSALVLPGRSFAESDPSAHSDLPTAVGFGAELGSTPFLAPAAAMAAVADMRLSDTLRGAAAVELWAKRGTGLRDAVGAAAAVVELAAGVRAEVAAPRLYTGLAVGVFATAARWIGGAYAAGSSFGAGGISLTLFHPIPVLRGKPRLTLRPGLSAFFSIGPNGFCTVPDLLPSLAVRAMW